MLAQPSCGRDTDPKEVLKETEAEHTDLLQTWWPSQGTFLGRFSELLPEIKEFLKVSMHAAYAQLEDTQWLLDIAFLTDLTYSTCLNVNKFIFRTVSPIRQRPLRVKLLSLPILFGHLTNPLLITSPLRGLTITKTPTSIYMA